MLVFLRLKTGGVGTRPTLVNVSQITNIISAGPTGNRSRIFFSGSDEIEVDHSIEEIVEMLRQAQVEVLSMGHLELPDNLTCPTCDGIIHIVEIQKDPPDIDHSSGTGLRITFACEGCDDMEHPGIEMLFGDHSGCMPFHFGRIAP